MRDFTGDGTTDCNSAIEASPLDAVGVLYGRLAVASVSVSVLVLRQLATLLLFVHLCSEISGSASVRLLRLDSARMIFYMQCRQLKLTAVKFNCTCSKLNAAHRQGMCSLELFLVSVAFSVSLSALVFLFPRQRMLNSRNAKP